jgi:hypothetical protein
MNGDRQCVLCGGHLGVQNPHDTCDTCRLTRKDEGPQVSLRPFALYRLPRT